MRAPSPRRPPNVQNPSPSSTEGPKGSTLATIAPHAPVRTCIGCRTTRPKGALVRLAATPDGVRVDETGRLPGRGAYVCPDPRCVEPLRRRSGAALRRALRTDADARIDAALDALAAVVVHPEVRQGTVRSENA